MRSSWTREELDGAFLVWLVEIHFPGQICRYATHTVNVVDGSREYHYPGTSLPMTFSRKADLFDGIPDTSEMGIAGYVDVDLPALYAAGFRFTGIYAEVSQVRARDWSDGLEVLDEYTDRRRLVAGRVRNPQWGRVMDDGHTYFAADVVTEWFASNATIPAEGLDVNNATWPEASRAATDEGVSFPVIIGYPGWDSASDIPVPAAPVCWLSRQYAQFQIICAGLGVLDAGTMQLVRGSDPLGVSVNLATEYEKYGGGGSLYPSITEDGTLLTVVDYQTEGYGNGGANDLTSPYYPTTVEESDVYVSFPEGEGGMMWRGRLLRDAGDVLGWALEQSGYRVDWGMTATATPRLSWAKVDTIISERVRASEWIQQSLLPLLPVSMMVGPDGIYPVVWRGLDVGPDECLLVDADADLDIEVSDTAFEDNSETANRFTVEYGWGAIAKETRYRVRVGPGAGVVPESDDYATTFIDNNQPMTARVRIQAVAKGFDGAGITIITGASGAPTAASDTGTKEVTINVFNGGTDNNDVIASAINSGSLLVTASPEGSAAVLWSEGNPATSRTFLRDYGTYPNARCEASRIRRRREAESGVVDAPTVEAPIVMDHATARGIAEWMAAAHAGERTTVSVEAPEATFCELLPLGPVLFTYSPLGFVERIGTAEEIEEHSNNRTAVRMVFLD